MKSLSSLAIVSLTMLSSLVFSQNQDSLDIVTQSKELRKILYSHTDSAQNIAAEMYFNSLENEFAWGQSQGLLFLAATYHRMSNYDTAIVISQMVIDLHQQAHDSVHLGSAYLNQGMCYVSIGNYDLGAEKTLESLRIIENLPKTREASKRSYLPRVYNILGQVYYYQSDFQTTEKYFRKYLELATLYQDTLLIGSANTNLGAVYFEMGDFDKSLEHDLRAAKIQESLGNKLGYANALQNIAIGLKYRDEFEKAIEYYKMALPIYHDIPNLKGVTEAYYNLGELYLETGQWGKAVKSYNDAIDLCNEAQNPEVLKWSLRGLSKVAGAKGDFKEALAKYKEYHTLSDSLVNEANKNKVSELQISYDTEKKEQEIDLLNKENELQAAIINRNTAFLGLAIAIIVLILAIAIILVRHRDIKAKAKLESEKSLMKSEQIEAVISSQEKERKRFAMDLHDDFGQMISTLKINVAKFSGESATKSEEILDSMYSSLKNIAFDLMPQTLFEKGLEEAIEELKEQINAGDKLQMSFQSFEIQSKINDNQKVAVYRIVQELVSNTIKYAEATKINVSITNLGEGFSLLIEDNGNGYDVDSFKNGSGNGWKNIRSRLDLLQGEIDFDSIEGRKNSTVSIEIPYQKSQQETKAA